VQQLRTRRRAAAFVAVGSAFISASMLTACGSGGGGAHGAVTAASGASSPSPTTTPPPALFPLTGLPTGSGPALRPALSVKIDNIADALPQSGINQADIVYEALVEGGLTRLFVTYQSHDAPVVGPIRSARPVDADLLDQLGGGIFAYSGAAPGEIAPSEDHSGATLLSMDSGVGAFYRDDTRRAPHNVYSSTDALFQAGAALGDHSSAPPPLFRFGEQPQGGTPAADADVPMGDRTTAAWHWNATDHVYERDQNGEADVVDDGSRITTENVLLMSVAIAGTDIRDVRGVEHPLVVVIGDGPCSLLRDGQLIQGHWSRAATGAPTQYVDATGAPLLLHPGRTWVELVQNALTPAFR